MVDRSKQTLDRSLSFLLAAQENDGSWRDFCLRFGESTSWVTAHVMLCLSFLRDDQRWQMVVGAVERAADFLLRFPRKNGGWGYNHNVHHPDDCDSTAHAILALSRIGYSSSIPAKSFQRLIEFEVEPGLFRTFDDPRTGNSWRVIHPEVSVMAVLALADQDRAIKLAKRLDADLNRFTCWPSFWWKGKGYSTYTSSWLASVFGMSELSKKARGLNLLRPPRMASALEYSWYGLAALYINDHNDLFEKLTDRLIRMQLRDGSWPTTRMLRQTYPEFDNQWLIFGKSRGRLFVDQRRIYTTASVLRFLYARYERRLTQVITKK